MVACPVLAVPVSFGLYSPASAEWTWLDCVYHLSFVFYASGAFTTSDILLKELGFGPWYLGSGAD